MKINEGLTITTLQERKKNEIVAERKQATNFFIQ